MGRPGHPAGGSGPQVGLGIAVDGAGNAYVTGETYSTTATFPETSGVFQGAPGGSADAFVARIAANDPPTKANQSAPARVAFVITDRAGNRGSCY